jgi:hypothetical protein
MKTITTFFMLLLYSIVFGQNNLTNAEYFIDDDPGYGNATPLLISGDTVIIDELITNEFSLGVHTIYLRVKDENDTWGMAEAVPFLIREYITLPEVSPVVQAEYFFGEDPGFGLANEIIIGSSDTIIISELIPNNGLPTGLNAISLRVKNDNDVWGISQKINFYVREDRTIEEVKIVGMEYFIGDDPGPGNGTYIALNEGDTLHIEEWLPSQELSDGIHQIGIRMQSDSGIWGLREWREFEFLNCEDEGVSIVSTDNEFCENDSLLIEGPTGYNQYSWNTNQSDSQIYATLEGDYFASVYDSTNHTCFLSDTLSAIMLQAPNGSFDYDISFATINAQALYLDQDFFWQINDEFTSMEASINYSFSEDGWQSICLEASNICGVEELCDTILICAEVESAPYFYIDNDGDGFGVATDSVKACSIPVGFADNNLDCDDNDNSINPSAMDIPNDGIDQDCDGLDLVTAINDMDMIAFQFYPNPASDIITLKFSKDFTGFIEILDVRGKRINSLSVDNENKTTINVGKIPPGMYLLQLTTINTRSIKQLIIQ